MFSTIGVPQNEWFISWFQTLLKLMIWVENPLFSETPIWLMVSTHLKNMLVKIGSFPQGSGWKQKIFELPPPSHTSYMKKCPVLPIPRSFWGCWFTSLFFVGKLAHHPGWKSHHQKQVGHLYIFEGFRIPDKKNNLHDTPLISLGIMKMNHGIIVGNEG